MTLGSLKPSKAPEPKNQHFFAEQGHFQIRIEEKMGKMETWEVTGRTNETVTITYKRRVYKEDVFPQSTGKSQGKPMMVDKETKDMLKRLSGMSKDIRKKYRIEKKEEEKSFKKNKKNRVSKKPEDVKSLKDDSEEEDHINVDGVLIKKGAKGEPCDHRGVPLSHPMAMTPYPGASTAAQREKARKMLKEIARQMHEEDLKKQGILKKSEKSENSEKSEEKSAGNSLTGSSNLTTQTSDLSSISSAATSSKTSGKSSKSKSKSKSTSKSSKNSRSSNKKMGCDKCGSCQKCIHRCSQKHAADVKVTDYEREQFLNGIKRLRKKIVKPEKNRERATKSPYDVTQSESELELTSGSSSKSAKTSKKSSAEK
ncbi:hypothetical protein L3Y34_016518 [Caenorhabditis briggsae]|uniref:Uncharacterized protein n=1 Tax=Caenorhabditis briggsae TaxID=6238 RepID=A0AAE9J0M3_CAEBR|nr:hypothetical protein L3Y34_016518 [Caenorhabditis briggsae]